MEAKEPRGDFSVELAAPSGDLLTPGDFTGAQRYPFDDRGRPGISISGSGRGCNQNFGRFLLRDVRFTPSGKLTHAWALFGQQCEGPGAPA